VALYKAPHRQQKLFDISPTWPALPAPIKHQQQSGSGGLLPAPAPKEPRRLVSKHSAQALISPFAEAGF